jgi:hypothetical protein
MSKAPPVTAGLFYWMQAGVKFDSLLFSPIKNPPSCDGGFA